MAVGESLAKFQLPSLAVQRLRDTGAHDFEDSREAREAIVGLVCDWVAGKG